MTGVSDTVSYLVLHSNNPIDQYKYQDPTVLMKSNSSQFKKSTFSGPFVVQAFFGAAVFLPP
jgi:hypothetical protein